MLAPKVTKNSKGETMTLYVPAIDKIHRAEILHTAKHAGGVDKLTLHEGYDKSGQLWRWYQITRTMKGHTPYTLPEYGWIRVTRKP